MRHSVLVALLSAVVMSVPLRAGAQATWSDSLSCAVPASSEPLHVYIPGEVIDRLERTKHSAFVHAFLIGLIADSSAGEHRLSRCARQFIDGKPRDFARLRQSLPDAEAIIGALREAERQRSSLAQLSGTLTSVDSLATHIMTDTTLATLPSAMDAVKSRACNGDASACQSVRTLVAAMDSVRLARSAADKSTASARQAAALASDFEHQVETATGRIATETRQLDLVGNASREDSSTASAEIQKRVTTLQHSRDSLVAVRDSANGSAAAALLTRRADSLALQDRMQRLSSAWNTVHAQLAIARWAQAKVSVPLEKAYEAYNKNALAVAQPDEEPVAPTVRPVNIMLELTDFILARARREVVNSFIINLYALGVHEPLLQVGFPDTWGLMNGLAKRYDGNLNAVDVGRISLATWRATLASDFVTLPATLIEAGPVGLCATDQKEAPESRAALTATNPCRHRAATLIPLAPAARRLINGAPLFDVLRDAGTFAVLDEPDAPPEWRRLAQGLGILSDLADAYYLQGQVKTPDPMQNPYILTVRTLIQAPQRQRDAFLRVLLVRAVTARADVPLALDEAKLGTAIVNTTRVIEQIASQASHEDLHGVAAAQLVHTGFDALVASISVGKLLASRDSSAMLDSVAARWRMLSAAVEPLFAHDFALSLARTTTLLRSVRGDVPAPMITFAALASSLSEARNGAQVQAAFEAAASPVGGWQAKRYGEGGVSITAFPGFAAGGETILRHPADADGTGTPALTVGVSLPVGVEWMFSRSGPHGASACHWAVCGNGFFMPVIDLGALMSYRVSHTAVVQPEPNSSFQELFAPGLYLSFAMSRTIPITLLTGAQLMPALRSVDTSAGLSKRSAVRFGVNIGVDVKLLGF